MNILNFNHKSLLKTIKIVSNANLSSKFFNINLALPNKSNIFALTWQQ